jgi:DNA-binding MarR family transcriptional regulator
MHDTLEGQAVPDVTRTEVETIGRAMGQMRLMMGRRIITRLAADQLTPGLDLSHFDVIEAVRRAGEAGEPTVGAVAEALRIDHSRGSRLITDLIQRGLLRRAVSQADARRTVVELTEVGQALVVKIGEVKRGFIRNVVADWSEDEVSRFANLFERFVVGFAAEAQRRSSGA